MGRRMKLDECGQQFVKLRDSLSLEYSSHTQQFQKMVAGELLPIQARVGLGSTWGVLEFPEAWMPRGVCRKPSQRIVDVCGWTGVDPGADPKTADLVILTMTRLALVLFFVPSVGPSIGTVYLSPATIASELRHACYIARVALRAASTQRSSLFGGLSQQALQEIGLKRSKKRVTINRFVSLSERGYWSDVPRCLADPNNNGRYSYLEEPDPPEEPESPRSVDVSPEEANGSDDSSGKDSTGPLSDRFVSEIGVRACWFVDVLGPKLLDCLTKLQSVALLEGSPDWDKRQWKNARARRGKRVRKVLASYDWGDVDHRQMIPPFALRLSGTGNHRGKTSGAHLNWPPKSWAQLLGLASLTQTLNMYVVLLATAGRISEVLSLSLSHSPKKGSSGMFIEGRTYKLVFVDDGAKMEWPLPDFVVRVVERQGELRRVLESFIRRDGPAADGRPSDEAALLDLWATVTSGAPLDSWYDQVLINGLAPFGLEELLDGTRLHAHRFRTTMARLIALAVVGAPKIIMDFFGHRTIEMTLRYILKDPIIRLEIAEVAKAQIIMLASDAVQQADACGGPAAENVQRAVGEMKIRLGRELDAKDVKELAEVLTMSGTNWQLVRPSVVCTKLPDQAGACNHRRGYPEPAACRSDCAHRLEMAALREDVDLAIGQAVKELDRDVAMGNDIMAEMWRGQILANLKRFPDIEEKWKRSERFVELMVGEATTI